MKRFFSLLRDKSLLLFLGVFLFYFNTSYTPTPSDTISTLFLPVAFLNGHGFYLDSLYPFFLQHAPSGLDANNTPYYLFLQKGHYISFYPVWSAILSLPFYFFPTLIAPITPENIEQTYLLVVSLGKFSASFFTAFSVLFVYKSLRYYLKENEALIVSIFYAFGTSSLPISSQQIWQHGPTQFLMALALFLLVRADKRGRLSPLLGLVLSIAVITRFSTIVPVAFIALYVLIFYRSSFIKFVAWTVPAVLFLVWYNFTFLENPLSFGGYEKVKPFETPLLEGLAGVLFAPNKGLFIYSPFFLFIFLSFFRIFFVQKRRFFLLIGVCIVSFTILTAKWTHWHGGWSFGPRLMVDIAPFMVFLLVPLFTNGILRKKIFLFLFWFLGILSILIQLIGLVYGKNVSWYMAVATTSSSTSYLWDIKGGEFAYYLSLYGGVFGLLGGIIKEIFAIIAHSIPWALVIGVFYAAVIYFESFFSKTDGKKH